VLASGAPETVRNDPSVREAYLGDAEFGPLAPLAGRGSG
jgi:hypothetical protein